MFFDIMFNSYFFNPILKFKYLKTNNLSIKNVGIGWYLY